MQKINLNGLAKDLVSLGGIPFFILVLTRVWILHNLHYFIEFFISGIIFIFITLIFKAELYSGLSLVVLVFTSIHYNDLAFTIVASIAYILLIVSLIYLKKDKKSVFLGVLYAGIICLILYLFNKGILHI